MRLTRIEFKMSNLQGHLILVSQAKLIKFKFVLNMLNLSESSWFRLLWIKVFGASIKDLPESSSSFFFLLAFLLLLLLLLLPPFFPFSPSEFCRRASFLTFARWFWNHTCTTRTLSPVSAANASRTCTNVQRTHYAWLYAHSIITSFLPLFFFLFNQAFWPIAREHNGTTQRLYWNQLSFCKISLCFFHHHSVGVGCCEVGYGEPNTYSALAKWACVFVCARFDGHLEGQHRKHTCSYGCTNERITQYQTS